MKPKTKRIFVSYVVVVVIVDVAGDVTESHYIFKARTRVHT